MAGMDVVLKFLALTVIVALAAGLLICKDRRGRFGLKTLLLITALAAVLLGVMVLQSQWRASP